MTKKSNKLFQSRCWLLFSSRRTRLLLVQTGREVWDTGSCTIPSSTGWLSGWLLLGERSWCWNTRKDKEADRLASELKYSSACTTRWSPYAKCSADTHQASWYGFAVTLPYSSRPPAHVLGISVRESQVVQREGLCCCPSTSSSLPCSSVRSRAWKNTSQLTAPLLAGDVSITVGSNLFPYTKQEHLLELCSLGSWIQLV